MGSGINHDFEANPATPHCVAWGWSLLPCLHMGEGDTISLLRWLVMTRLEDTGQVPKPHSVFIKAPGHNSNWDLPVPSFHPLPDPAPAWLLQVDTDHVRVGIFGLRGRNPTRGTRKMPVYEGVEIYR